MQQLLGEKEVFNKHAWTTCNPLESMEAFRWGWVGKAIHFPSQSPLIVLFRLQISFFRNQLHLLPYKRTWTAKKGIFLDLNVWWGSFNSLEDRVGFSIFCIGRDPPGFTNITNSIVFLCQKLRSPALCMADVGVKENCRWEIWESQIKVLIRPGSNLY